MESRRFLLQLLIASIVCAGGIGVLYRFPGMASGIALAWQSLGFFIGFSLLMYASARRIAKSEKKERYISLILGFSGLKMLCSFLLIAIYAKTVEPDSRLFALPFFGVYLVFTIFESAFMIRIGKR
jgi:hypothetical protein